MNLDNNPPEVKSVENNITSTRATIICINNNENKFLAQVLKNQDVFFKDKDKIAKGVNNAKILIITYLKEYVNNKCNIEKEIAPFNNPFNVNIFKALLETEKTELEIFIIWLKLTSFK